MKTLKDNANAQKLSDKLIDARQSDWNEFKGIEHRLEFVKNINGTDYLNDSKATDVNSTWYSLDYMTAPVVWIVGISDFETNYDVFSDLVKEKVKAIICLGENKDGALNALINNVDCFAEAGSVSEAVEISKSLAKSGDVVLFSPACSSFHLFLNYKDRGEQFRKAVNQIP